MRLRLLALLAACACAPAQGPGDEPEIRRLGAAQDEFWSELQGLCGRAYAGRVVEGNASDSSFRNAELRMHVRECAPAEIRVPFHVGMNRSRTWVITRTGSGLRLKHDHRHEDGTDDAVTLYGGDTRAAGTRSRQEFHADAHTASIIPAARTNIWTIELVPGELFAYALRREGTDRRFRVEFDLKKPIPLPPAPWGATQIFFLRPEVIPATIDALVFPDSRG